MSEGERREGEVLDGRYRLGPRLGRGGFGDVWRAEELLPDGTTLREVALKLLHGSVATAPDWSAEARIIASLRHPALVTVYAAGVLAAERPIPFVAMELLIGGSLAELGSQGRVPWRRVMSWAREAAAALDVIHRAGVVHLDLKPANLFLAEGGLKVLDFGIARQGMARAAVPEAAVAADDMSTAAFMIEHPGGDETGPVLSARTVVGTPGFMAPEIFEDGETSPATDAYALAACMVQLCTGRLPHDVATRPASSSRSAGPTPSTGVGAWFAEIQAATVRGQLRDLAADHPELPSALVVLLQRWLAVDPAARGIERGSLRSALDEVWACPFGWSGNPYRGLATYRPRDEGKLFGRDAEVARLARDLVDLPGVVLYGDSAVGLSSLALAGIVPELGRRFADDKHDWVACEVSLSLTGSPDEQLDAAIVAHLALLDVPCGDDAHAVARLAAHGAGGGVGTVLVIDRLERLIAAPPEAREHIGALIAALRGGARGLRLVATANAEHVAELGELSGMGVGIQPWLRFVGPMPALGVEELVRGPAAEAGRSLDGEEDIIEQLQAELAADATRLPLLSLALARWWERGEGALSAAAWREGGGVVGRLREHAEAVYAGLSGIERRRADALFLRLLSADGSLVSVRETTILDASDAPAEMRAIVEQLRAERLIHKSGGKLRLCHAGLVEAWPHLSDLRLHHLDRLNFMEELRMAAGRWTASGYATKHLWPADMLRELGRWQGDVQAELGEDVRPFIAVSQRAQRIRWLLRAAAVLVALCAAMAGVWLNAQSERREREQRQRLAEERTAAALSRIITASRRTADPYLRVALLTKAIEAGSTDLMLPLELVGAARDLPSAEFLTLSKVSSPDFPWGERWLVGATAEAVVTYDFEPPAGPDWAPQHYRFRPHTGNLTDVIPLAYDSAVLTRDHLGEVRIWRLRENGVVALAAQAPKRCRLGPVVPARSAAVVACAAAEGIVRWDLHHADEAVVDPFVGRVLDVSPDGAWVAAARLDKLLLWNHASGARYELELAEAPSAARFSPRDPLVAVIHGHKLEVLTLASIAGAAPSAVIVRDVTVDDPVAAHWAESGIDLAVCDFSGAGEWHYLRSGARAHDDAPPPAGGKPCDERLPSAPPVLAGVRDYGPIGRAGVGPRVFEQGWKRKDGTLVTHDLVMFKPDDNRLRRLIAHRAQGSDAEASAGSSAALVVRAGERMVWQIGDEVRFHDLDGEEVLRKKGRLLGRCRHEGRLVAWRRGVDADAAARWELFDPQHDVDLGSFERKPGNVLGMDPGCHTVVVQWLDGALAAAEVGSTAGARPLESPGGAFVMDGYVYDVRPSYGREDTAEPWPDGLWLAFSDGAMVRVDGSDAHVRAYGHASPRALAMADGPEPGDLLFADETGVVLRRAAGDDDVLLRPMPDREWQDIALGPDRRTLWLSWAHGVVAVDLTLRDVVGDLEVPEHDRFAPWDDGSLLLWTFAFKGLPEAYVIPLRPELVKQIGEAASNIRAPLLPDMRALITLDQ